MNAQTHLNDPESDDEQTAIDDQGSDQFVCGGCGRSFDTKRGRSVHQATGHDEPWKDRDVLAELYIEKELSSIEIANRLGCSKQVVLRWLNKYEIERRSLDNAVSKAYLDDPPHYIVNDNGYCQVVHLHQREYQQVRIHRLIAVAEWGFDEVADNIVHHKNGIPWDNRPSNLSLVSDAGVHVRVHTKSNPFNGLPWRDRDYMERLYVDRGLPYRQIAEIMDCSHSTVRRWIEHHGLDR